VGSIVWRKVRHVQLSGGNHRR